MRERQNWRIFSSFARQEYTECLQIIEEQLQDCDGMAEYPIYVKGERILPAWMGKPMFVCDVPGMLVTLSRRL